MAFARRATLASTQTTVGNVAIKALQQTPVQLVAPVTGRLVLPSLAVVKITTTAGAYTNLDADSALDIAYDSYTDTPLTGILNVSNISLAALTAALATAAVHMAVFTSSHRGYGNTGQAQSSVFTDPTSVGLGLQLTMNNNIAGNLTGGNAANTIQVYLEYRLISFT